MDEELEKMTEWVQAHIKRLADDYWIAYYWRRDECKKKRIPMDWHAGCRVKENVSGARLEWFYIRPVGRGKKSTYLYIDMESKSTADQSIFPFASLKPLEKKVIKEIRKQEKDIRQVEMGVRDIRYKMKGVKKAAKARGFIYEGAG